MPRTTNPQAARLYRSIAKPYDVIAEVFKDGDINRLRQEFEAGKKVWQDVRTPALQFSWIRSPIAHVTC